MEAMLTTKDEISHRHAQRIPHKPVGTGGCWDLASGSGVAGTGSTVSTTFTGWPAHISVVGVEMRNGR